MHKREARSQIVHQSHLHMHGYMCIFSVDRSLAGTREGCVTGANTSDQAHLNRKSEEQEQEQPCKKRDMLVHVHAY